MVASSTSSYRVSQHKLRSNGVLITLAILITIEVLTRTLFRVPAPVVILLLPVAYAAFTGGLRSGLISATLMFLYSLYLLAVPGQFLQYTSSSLGTLAVLALVAATMVFMIGSLKQRIEQLSRRNALILQSAGEGICGLDAEGAITFLNPAAATMCGWTVDELVGQPIHVLMQRPHADDTSASLADTPSDLAWRDLSVRVVVEGLFWRKDGTSFPVEYIRSPKWEHGTLVGAVVTFKDISERKRAEVEQRFLVEASTLLGTSLDYTTTLEQVAQLAVPTIADWCTVHLVTESGTVQQLALAHVDPAKVAWAAELQRRYPPDPNVSTGVFHVLRSGQTEFYPEISDALLEATIPDPEQLELVRAVGFTSAIIVPLIARGRTLGALTLVSAESRRPFGAAERDLAEDVARRAAQAIDNARLYRAAKDEITERQAAEAALREREASFRLLFANNPLPMWVYDLDTLAFLEVNQAAVAHYGYSRSEFLEMRITDIRPHADLPMLLEQLQQERAALEVTGPWRHRLHDGRLITVIIHSHTLDFAGQRAVLVVAEDITERQQAAEAIQHLNADLERRVAERTAQLEVTNKELEAFSYSVSHDLRAPLRSIDGFSLALLEDYGDQLDADGQDYLQRVRSATQRMSQLIDDLLSLARVTRSALNYESVDLSACAGSIADELQRAQPDRQAEYLIAPDLIARGDGRLLRVMLENLLGNAWKFTVKRQCATIEFGAIPIDGQVAYFVRDNGAGFDMAYADKLFGAFQRLHAMSEFPGTGVGLATVQRIIHRHGGRVWAESAVEQGATFYFTLS